MDERHVYTIGHSTHPIEKLLGLLATHQVTAVADVRSQPYSRMNPQFNREALQTALKLARIGYVFLGRELGARAEDPACYADGRVQYDALARTPLFLEGIARVVQGVERYRVSLLCAEKDPLTCHRTILVSRHLASRGVSVQHILEDGRLESHDAALARLLQELGISDRELFRDREQLIAEAYARRGHQIAYTEKQPDVENGEREARR